MNWEQNQKKIISVLIVCVVIIVGLVFVFSNINYKKQIPQQATVKVNTLFSKPEYAEPGKLVQSFPASLVLDKTSVPDESFNYSYKNNEQSTATFQSQVSPKSEFSQYKEYLAGNGWKVVNEVSSDKTGTYSLYATNANAEISLILQPQSGNTKITVNYLSTINYLKS